MRAISLSNEPLVVSYALRQLIESGELGVVSAGDKASVVLPIEKYEALVNVLRWLETPLRRTAKTRPRKASARGPRAAAADLGSTARGRHKAAARASADLFSVLEG